ncbi:MAG TPA: glycosyltransferase family 39 protein [Chloroflexota bacterium]|nr:glycosyltransferase family 39 protein [Chloroflexota bacterium]
MWRQTDTLCLLAVLAAGATTRLAFTFRAPLFVVNDSLSYLLPAWELIHGEGFFPLFKRPPLYPLLVAKILWLFGEDPQAIATVQHMLGLAIVALTFVLGFLLAGRIGGVIAGLLSAVSGPLILTEQYLMSETLFCLTLTLAITAFILVQRIESGRLAALSGAFLALAVLTRPVAQLLLPLFALWLLYCYWSHKRAAARLVVSMWVAYAVLVTPWMLRNLFVQGSFTVAGGMGEGLAVRTIRYEQRFDFRANDPGESDLLRSARRIYRDEAGDGSAFELAARLRDELHVTPLVADGLMRDIAAGAIRQRPIYYFSGTLEMFWSMLSGKPARLRQDWVPWRGIVWDDRVRHLLPAASPLQDAEFPIAEQVVSLYDPARWWPAVLGAALIGIVLPPTGTDRRCAALLAIVILGELFTSAALVGIEWRYRYPLDPLINVLIGIGAAGIATRLLDAGSKPSSVNAKLGLAR